MGRALKLWIDINQGKAALLFIYGLKGGKDSVNKAIPEFGQCQKQANTATLLAKLANEPD